MTDVFCDFYVDYVFVCMSPPSIVLWSFDCCPQSFSNKFETLSAIGIHEDIVHHGETADVLRGCLDLEQC